MWLLFRLLAAVTYKRNRAFTRDAVTCKLCYYMSLSVMESDDGSLWTDLQREISTNMKL